jgi:hypothetical protein
MYKKEKNGGLLHPSSEHTLSRANIIQKTGYQELLVGVAYTRFDMPPSLKDHLSTKDNIITYN